MRPDKKISQQIFAAESGSPLLHRHSSFALRASPESIAIFSIYVQNIPREMALIALPPSSAACFEPKIKCPNF
jgi:hypothetical protein